MPEDDKIQRLQDFLETEIPLLAHMAVQISRPDARTLRVIAPIGPNSNHHGTAFGGSIAALGIACGWAWTYLRLQEEALACKLVIQKAAVDYLAPVHADFTAECRLADDSGWQDFTQCLRNRKRARIELSVPTYCDGKRVAQHQAVYAAIID